MEKRKLTISLALVALAVGALIAVQALAADLHTPHVGSFCEAGPGEWHFVNNQARGAAQGTLTAVFDDVGEIQVMAEKVNSSTQHFYISGPVGPLLSASTNLPGRLVLSDLECGPGCVPEPEICDNGVDDDCDDLIDCDDLEDCKNDPACDGGCVPEPEICDNNIDDDCDGLIDCADGVDCKEDPACLPCVAEICDNNIDDDCDGLIDCADGVDCKEDPACLPCVAEICDNNIDDDCDGLIDCADGVDCKEDPACLP